jgi:hypothetical protein
MDEEIIKLGGKKYAPYRKGNLSIIYYEDRSIHELRSGKDMVSRPSCPPVYLL